jgi:hypothetical protein
VDTGSREENATHRKAGVFSGFDETTRRHARTWVRASAFFEKRWIAGS